MPTVHCSGCTIRNTVTEAWEIGQLHNNVPAYLERSLGSGPDAGAMRLELLISTEKRGGMVFLRIDKIEPAEEAADDKGRGRAR